MRLADKRTANEAAHKSRDDKSKDREAQEARADAASLAVASDEPRPEVQS